MTEELEIEPHGNKILLEPIVQKQIGRIILPENAKDRKKNRQGKVIAVGAGKIVDGNAHPIGFEVGDHLVYSEYNSIQIEIDGKELVFVDGDDVLGRVRKKSKAKEVA